MTFNNEWKIINYDHSNKYIQYCKKFTDNIYTKGVYFCKNNNINQHESIFLFGSNENDTLYIINNPFNFDNSIYNLHEYYNLLEDKSKILKYHKNIINSLTKTKRLFSFRL